MAKMGERKQSKRIAAPASWKIKRKVGGKWVTKVIPGPHPKERSIPLRILVRDILKICDNSREADYIIKNGLILVDGVARKEPRFPVGLFDIVEIPLLKKTYRIVLDEHGRVIPREENETESRTKLCRVERKKTTKGGKTQVSTHDGRCFIVENGCNVGDVFRIKLPGQEIIEILPLKEGSKAYILSGKHAGTVGVVEEILPGDIVREKRVKIKVDNYRIETALRNVFVIG